MNVYCVCFCLLCLGRKFQIAFIFFIPRVQTKNISHYNNADFNSQSAVFSLVSRPSLVCTSVISLFYFLSKICMLRWPIYTVESRQSKFIGHVMRKGELELVVTTRKYRGRVRTRVKILGEFARWQGKMAPEQLHRTNTSSHSA